MNPQENKQNKMVKEMNSKKHRDFKAFQRFCGVS